MKTLAIVLLAALASAACTTTQPRNEFDQARYASKQAQSAGKAVEMHVVSVRPVEIKPDTTNTRQATGAAVGGALGGLVGNQVARGKHAGTAIGGLLGAAGGALLSERGAVPGQEIVLRDPRSNSLLVVVQAGTDVRPGETAYVITHGGTHRVTRK